MPFFSADYFHLCGGEKIVMFGSSDHSENGKTLIFSSGTGSFPPLSVMCNAGELHLIALSTELSFSIFQFFFFLNEVHNQIAYQLIWVKEKKKSKGEPGTSKRRAVKSPVSSFRTVQWI